MRRNGGFTLFEVLLAVGIVLLVTAVMAETIRVSFSLKRAAERAIESVRDIQTVGDLWVRDVRNSVPPNPNSSVDPTTIDNSATTANTTGTLTGSIDLGYTDYIFGPFYGDDSTMSFYTTGTEKSSIVQSGVEYVSYSLEQQSDGTWSFVRQVETNLLSDTDPTTFPSGEQPEILVSNVVSVKFSYYDGTSWYDTWDSTQMTNTLPYSVEMEMTLAGARPEDPQRVIKRYASISCAAPPPDTTSTDTTGGIIGFGGHP